MALKTAAPQDVGSKDGWTEYTLGAIGDAYGGLTGKTKADFGTGAGRYITFLNVIQNPVLFPRLFQNVRIRPGERQNRARAGDLFFNASSETPEEVGMCSLLVDDHEDLFLNSFCIGFRLKPDAPVDAMFLAYFFRSTEGRGLFRSLAQGSTRYNLSKGAIGRMVVCLPPLKEQRLISAALRDFDVLIASLRHLVVKKKGVRAAVRGQLVTGKTRLPGFVTDWRTLPFDDVLGRVNGKPYQVTTADYRPYGRLPVVDQGKREIVAYTDGLDRGYEPPQDGVVVFGDHTCIVKFADFPFAVGAEGTQLLRTKKGQVAQFHYYQLVHDPIPATGYNRHFKFLRERTFLAPPEEEQRSIAAVLAAIDAEIAALEKRLAKTQAVRLATEGDLMSARRVLRDDAIARGGGE